MPAVQSKETLLLNYDYTENFSKRKLVSNWGRYDEMSDEEDNPQMLAGDFEKILLAPQSVGSHFTFASERHWEQGESTTHEEFQLDLNKLKNGVCLLPFYLRHNLSKDIFIEDELNTMNPKVYYEEKNLNKDISKNRKILPNAKSAKSGSSAANLNKEILNVHRALPSKSKSAQLTEQMAKLVENTGRMEVTELKKSSNLENNVEKSENIQDWLDDILND